MSKKINVGILGCAKVLKWILPKFNNNQNFHLKAIASRDTVRSFEFSKTNNIENFYSSYDELLDDKSIDLVYIPLINSLHTEWILKAAHKNKHILVEKPICLTSSDCKLIEKAQEENNVIICEGVMTQYHLWQDTIIDLIKKEKYGKLNEINTVISTKIEINEKEFRFKKSLGGGVFFDESCYWLQVVQNIVGLKIEKIIYADKKVDGNGCDIDFRVAILLDNCIKSSFFCTFEGSENYVHEFVFDQAILRVKNFFRCCYGEFKLHIDVVDNDGNQLEKISFEPSNYYENQLNNIAKLINNKTIKYNQLAKSFERIKTMEEIYQSAIDPAKNCYNN